MRYVAQAYQVETFFHPQRSADNVSSRAIEDRHRRIGGSENE